MKNSLEMLFISRNAVHNKCGLLALEAPGPIFAQGYISACGDAFQEG